MIKKLIVGLVALVLVIVVGVMAIKSVVGESSWHAIYLRTGELYFGHLTRFPFGLKNVYMLQANPSNKETPLSIQKFSKIFWGPQDWLRVNREEVVWTTELDAQGQLAQILNANPELQPAPGNVNQNPLPSGLSPQTTPAPTQNKQ